MIISHKLKCIYMKNGKVAGSSLEIALSQYCGPDDIMAPLDSEEEDLRKHLGSHGAQNFEYLNQQGKRCTYVQHTPATEIKKSITPEIWNRYLKIASIRCPYDAFISGYYFNRHFDSQRWNNLLKHKKRSKLELWDHLWLQILVKIAKIRVINTKYASTFEIFVREFQESIGKHKIMHIDGKIAADFLVRYEHLTEDIKELETKINCPGLLDTFQNIKAKRNMRPKGTATYEMYSIYPNAKLMVDEILYKKRNQYEFLRKYGPAYKSKLEEIITYHQKSTYFKLKCLVKKVLFKINSIMLGILINKYTKKLLP